MSSEDNRGLTTFSVVLDNRSKSYFPGQQVTGRIILDLAKQKIINGIHVTFTGKGAVKWTESVSGGQTEQKIYEKRETYFHKDLYVLGQAGYPQFVIPPGQHEFQISFRLPLEIPSSFRARYGNIQYTISATIIKPWGYDETTTTPFTVNGFVDLNYIQGAGNSVEFKERTYVGCLWCKDGPISFLFQIKKKGFVPGEPFGFKIKMDNQSNKTVEWIKVRLNRRVTFWVDGRKMSDCETIKTFNGGGVGPHQVKTWPADPQGPIVPPIPPTYLSGCRIMKIQYYLNVEMHIPYGLNLEGSTEVIIGTIPFRNTFTQIRPHVLQQSDIPGEMPNPTAPPLSIAEYPDLPPPAYHDIFPGDMPWYSQQTEDDAFDPAFVPTYATYEWK